MSTATPAFTSRTTRRRACTSCQQAKRRCDQRLPRCSRCVQKNLFDCHYPRLEATVAAQDHNIFVEMLGGAAPATSPALSTPGFKGHNNETSYFPQAPMADFAVPEADPYTWSPFFYGDAQTNLGFNHWGSLPDDRPNSHADEVLSWPRRWALQGEFPPFVHPSLYDSSSSAGPSSGGLQQTFEATGSLESRRPSLPPALQHCFCACTAYALKRLDNADLVFSAIETKVTDLTNCNTYPEEAWVMPPPLTEQLAALQALILYQVMRWFDEDPLRRVLADTDRETLGSWTDALQSRAELESILATPTGAASDAIVTGTTTPDVDISEIGGKYDKFAEYLFQEDVDVQFPQATFADTADTTMGTGGSSGGAKTPFSLLGTSNNNSPFLSGAPSLWDDVSGTNQTTTITTDSPQNVQLEWRQWLLSESIRRTLMTSHLIQLIDAEGRKHKYPAAAATSHANAHQQQHQQHQRRQQQQVPGHTSPLPPNQVIANHHTAMQKLPFTSSTRLWSASSSEEWHSAIRNIMRPTSPPPTTTSSITTGFPPLLPRDIIPVSERDENSRDENSRSDQHLVAQEEEGHDMTPSGSRWWWIDKLDFNPMFRVAEPDTVDGLAELVASVVVGRDTVEGWKGKFR